MSQEQQKISGFDSTDLLLASIFCSTYEDEIHHETSTTTSLGVFSDDPNNSDSLFDFLSNPELQSSTNEPAMTPFIHNIDSTLPSTNGFIDQSMSMNFTGGTEQVTSIEQESLLNILIQPKEKFRMRFESEMNHKKKRLNRYVPGHLSTKKKPTYPTIDIPSWIDQSRTWYIRVTLVTVTNDRIHEHYIHPYSILASETDVIRSSEDNSLYFPITIDEIASRKKSFKILLMQPTHGGLLKHGPLRLFNTNQIDDKQVIDSDNVKKFIDTYQLSKCQLVFTLAKRMNSTTPTIWNYFDPSVITNPMEDEKKNSTTDQNGCSSNEKRVKQITIIPSESQWDRRTSVVLIFPYVIKKKSFKIYFDFGSNQRIEYSEPELIDTKTMIIQTPICPVEWLKGEKTSVSLNIEQDEVSLPLIPFSYISQRFVDDRNIFASEKFCSKCRTVLVNQPNKNKRGRYDLLEEEDGPESLSKSFNRLTVKDERKSSQTKVKRENFSIDSKSTTTSYVSVEYKASYTKLKAYVDKLKDAVSEFIRTDDPSLLFRRTRSLLLETADASPPLHDAIRMGHVKLVEKLFKQTIDVAKGEGLLDQTNIKGQTPLLIAARYNRWTLIEFLLRQREDLAEKIDDKKNNFLHLLVEHQHVETIRFSLLILSKNLKEKLLNEKNECGQRPVDIAQLHELTEEIVKLLTCAIDNE